MADVKSVAFFSALLMLPLAGACTSPAASAPAQLASTAQNVGPNGEPLLCRRLKVTGTRFAKKECKTEEAWAQYDEYTNGNARESTDKLQRLNTGCSTQAEGGC